MSIDLVKEIARELPWKVAEDVVSYARSVRDAIPEIFREANLKEDSRLSDEIVFLAGIKKLHAICSTNFWILDNSLTALENADVGHVRFGSVVVSRGSDYWRRSKDILTAIEQILSNRNIKELVEINSYSEIARRLSYERR